MKLSTLNPLFTGDLLIFDCPTCACEKAHRIRVPLHPDRANQHGCWWSMAGTYPETITLSPSIDAGCWHGHVTEGKIV